MDRSATDITHHQLPHNWQIQFYFLFNLACSHHQLLHIKGIEPLLPILVSNLARFLFRYTSAPPPPTLALCIAYLFHRNYAPSTVNTYVSAFGYSSPVPRSVFYATRSAFIKLVRLDSSRYQGHSFRSRATFHTAEKGISDAQFRVLRH